MSTWQMEDDSLCQLGKWEPLSLVNLVKDPYQWLPIALHRANYLT